MLSNMEPIFGLRKDDQKGKPQLNKLFEFTE